MREGEREGGRGGDRRRMEALSAEALGMETLRVEALRVEARRVEL